MTYDFSTLSPHDFELLTQDLLQKKLGFSLEGFKSGRDGGIDLRRSQNLRSGLIVQCKHYHRSSFSQLKRTLQKTELPKIAKLSPKRYIVVTSKSLSVKEKDTLADILAPYCMGTNDILGAEDLNALLREYPSVEKTHFKLWIASAAVLQTVLNNDLFSRSYLETEEIKTRLSLFVPTAAVSRAMKALQTHGFCLLSGIPGIGKTTTAEMLVAILLDKEWECVCVSSNVSEAMRAYNPDRQQVFYYDDFLGQTSLTEKLGKNEDHQLSKLIRTCETRPKTKRLILTTRNYLLAQAIEQHELLARAKVDTGTCVVELADYTPPVRAKILVNHLWFYGVNDTWCKKLIKSGTAREIVDHDNYSPRLVEAICQETSTKRKTAASFSKGAIHLLDDPADLWRHAYQNQLSKTARKILVCFASLGNGCFLKALRISYQSFALQRDDDMLADENFLRGLRELEGTFLQIIPSDKLQTVAYNNPSVKDFMDSVFAASPACSRRVLKSSMYYNQVGYSAQYLLKTKRDKSAETLVCTSLRKHILAKSAVPDRIDRMLISSAPTQPANRLLIWRRIYLETCHETVRAELCKLAIEYLNSIDFKDDSAFDIAELVRLTVKDRLYLSVDSNIEFYAVKEWLWDNLLTLDSHRAMGWWIDEWEEGEDKQNAESRLHESFMDCAEKILDDLADNEHSSSDIEEGIDEILDMAKEFGVEANELDIYKAEEAKEAAEEAEEREADMHQDERQIQRHEEKQESGKIDDILDSLG